MRKMLIFLIIVNTSLFGLHAQNKTVKGRVISEALQTMPFVSIMINDSVEIGKTDLNGFFLIEIPANEYEIQFDYIGIEPTTIELVNNCDNIEVIIMLLGNYNLKSLKHVDRKRKKGYYKLPEVHKQAFEQGLFEREYPCYNREFEPYYARKGKGR